MRCAAPDISKFTCLFNILGMKIASVCLSALTHSRNVEFVRSATYIYKHAYFCDEVYAPLESH